MFNWFAVATISPSAVVALG